MAMHLRQSTASQSVKIGPFVSSTDGVTAQTGLTIANTDIKLSKNGAAFANKNSGGGTHDALGFYTITLDATDTGTVGRLQLACQMAGALVVYHEFEVLTAAAYDAIYGSSAAPATDAGVSAVGTAVAGLNNLSAAQVNAEVVDALNVDTYAEPGQATPGATLSLAAKIGYLYKAWRNKVEQTASEYRLFNDDGSTVGQKRTVGDDGTVTTLGEMTTGT
ncbi:MAG: hypothetical protein ACM31O_14075 [Bacteroidota bacterium]